MNAIGRTRIERSKRGGLRVDNIRTPDPRHIGDVLRSEDVMDMSPSLHVIAGSVAVDLFCPRKLPPAVHLVVMTNPKRMAPSLDLLGKGMDVGVVFARVDCG